MVRGKGRARQTSSAADYAAQDWESDLNERLAASPLTDISQSNPSVLETPFIAQSRARIGPANSYSIMKFPEVSAPNINAQFFSMSLFDKLTKRSIYDS